MNLRLLMAVAIFANAPIVALAQKDDHTPQPTLADAQKLVQDVSSDKAKLRAYCEMGQLIEQIEKAQEGNDDTAIEMLMEKADALGEQIGPEYLGIVEGLEAIDPRSPELLKFDAVFRSLRDKCK
jgi:hypothetical protein